MNTDTITFEHPLSERVRNFLRIEYLFARFQVACDNREPWAHHTALGALFELMDCAARAELKLEILQELERQRQRLHSQGRSEEQTLLHQTAKELQNVQQKFGQHLRENEWLMSIKQRMHLPGGTTPLDLPSYHYWQQLPYETRRQHLQNWLAALVPTGDAVRLLLDILRGNSNTGQHRAEKGEFHSDRLPPNTHMLTISLPTEYAALPEVSANKYFTHIRFLQASQTHTKGRQLDQTIEFNLQTCSFDTP